MNRIVREVFQELPRVDFAILTGINRYGGPGLFSEVYQIFSSQAALQFESLRMALLDSDLKNLTKVARRFKASTQTMGASRLAKVLEAIEQECLKNTPSLSTIEELGSLASEELRQLLLELTEFEKNKKAA